MTAVFAATYVLLAVGGLCTMVRLALGASALDRILALDVLQILLVSVVAVEAARTASPTFITLLLVVTLLAFVASVAAARFAGRGPS